VPWRASWASWNAWPTVGFQLVTITRLGQAAPCICHVCSWGKKKTKRKAYRGFVCKRMSDTRRMYRFSGAEGNGPTESLDGCRRLTTNSSQRPQALRQLTRRPARPSFGDDGLPSLGPTAGHHRSSSSSMTCRQIGSTALLRAPGRLPSDGRRVPSIGSGQPPVDRMQPSGSPMQMAIARWQFTSNHKTPISNA